MRLPKVFNVWTALLALALSACEPPPPPVPNRSYLYFRNSVTAGQPCRIAKFAMIPVTLVHNGAYVPVRVNGVFTIGLLDTGSNITMLTPAMAAAAKAVPDPNNILHHGHGVAGGFSLPTVQVRTLQIGGLKLTAPYPEEVVDFGGSSTDKIGALIGSNMINEFDWDFDFVHGQLTGYRTANCHDIDPLWDTKSTGLPITRVANKKFSALANLLGLPTNISLDVQFDTGVLKAIFDTGARSSYMTLEGAHKAGIANSQLHHDPEIEIAAIDGTKVKVRRHLVPEFVVGEAVEKDFTMSVAESLNSDADFDMILGMDWIATHRLWLSYTTDSLYIDSGEKKPLLWNPAPKLPN